MANQLHVPGKPARLFQLDALRGIGALTVVVYHLQILWSQQSPPSSPVAGYLLKAVSPFGTEAIMFFFLLSGFVLSLSAIEGKPQAWFTFVVRRIFRIYVPYLGALAVAVAGAFWLHGAVTRSIWFHAFWSEPVDWRLVGQHVLFVGSYNTQQFDCPIWSLVQEMRISLIFPALCWLVLRFKSRWSLGLAAALTCLAVLFGLPAVPEALQAYNSFQIAALFVFGIFLARERNRFADWYRGLPRFAKFLAGFASIGCFLFGGTCLILLTGHIFGRASTEVAQWMTAIGAGGIVMVSLHSWWCQKALAWEPIQFLARISYSLYLWHFVVLLYCVHLFYGRMPFAAVLGLAFVLMFPLSWLSFRWIELPSNALGRRLGAIRLKRPAHLNTPGFDTPGFESARSTHAESFQASSPDAVADSSAA
ncbi:MAG: acyltransferase [Terracidiphilus sp.]